MQTPRDLPTYEMENFCNILNFYYILLFNPTFPAYFHVNITNAGNFYNDETGQIFSFVNSVKNSLKFVEDTLEYGTKTTDKNSAVYGKNI